MKIIDAKVVVTGANRGLGRAFVAELLARKAARVYAGYRDPSAAEALRAVDARVVPVRLDVTDPTSIASAATSAADATVLINNAGVLDFGGVLDASDAALRRNLDVNYLGPLAVTRAFVPILERQTPAAIVNVLTLVALASMPGLGVYNASKAAAWSLTQSLRADLRARNIAVHAAFPAGIDTDMLAGVDAVKAVPVDVVRLILDAVERGDEDVFPDPVSQQTYAAWRDDHKAVERQFAS